MKTDVANKKVIDPGDSHQQESIINATLGVE